MSVGPPKWWLLNRMVRLTNNTLEIIERSDKKVLGNILNNDNTISGSNSFTGDNTFEGNCSFTDVVIDGNVIFNGNVRFDGGITETSRQVLTGNANYIVLNANIREQSFDFTYPAGIVIETHAEIHPRGYLFFDLSADRFWDLSGDNLSGNILQANTLRGNTIESSGTHKISFIDNIEVPLLFGNVSGNTATFSGNLTVLSSLNGNSATFTANVTAANFIGDLSGNVSGTVSSLSNFTKKNVDFGNVTASNFIGNVSGTVSSLSNFTKNNVDFGEVTATNFIGNIIGYNNLNIESTGSIDISSAYLLNISSDDKLIIESTQSIDISSTTVNLTNLDIQGNTNTSKSSMTARIDDGPDSWYVVMYNQRTKQLKFGTPPYT